MKKLTILVILSVLILSAIACGSGISDPVTATIQAQEKATERAKPTPTIVYEGITDFVDFATYPEKYKGKHLIFNCKVFNITSNKEFQCHLDDGESIAYVHVSKTFGDIYEGDKLTVSGTGYGKQCGTNAFGAKLCYSGVEADNYDKLP